MCPQNVEKIIVKTATVLFKSKLKSFLVRPYGPGAFPAFKFFSISFTLSLIYWTSQYKIKGRQRTWKKALQSPDRIFSPMKRKGLLSSLLKRSKSILQ